MKYNYLKILLMILLFLILSITPLPGYLIDCRPPFILLLLLYFQFYLPNYFTFFLITLLGISLDVLSGTLLGEQVFGLTLAILLAHNKARRVCFFSPAQQILFIGFLALCFQGTFWFLEGLQGYQKSAVFIFLPAISAMVFWPVMRSCMQKIWF